MRSLNVFAIKSDEPSSGRYGLYPKKIMYLMYTSLFGNFITYLFCAVMTVKTLEYKKAKNSPFLTQNCKGATRPV